MNRLLGVTERNELRREIGSIAMVRAPEVHRFLIRRPAHEIQRAVRGYRGEIDEDIGIDGVAEPNRFTPAIALAIHPPEIRARRRAAGEIVLHQRLTAGMSGPIRIEQQKASVGSNHRVLIEPRTRKARRYGDRPAPVRLMRNHDGLL
jgi:hypothetical protein